MDLKVNQISQPEPVELPKQTSQADGSFKFMLAGKIAYKRKTASPP